MTKHNTLPAHGSPADRGSADAYYMRPFDPHKWVGRGTGRGVRLPLEEGTQEWLDYRQAYYEQDDFKQWA